MIALHNAQANPAFATETKRTRIFANGNSVGDTALALSFSVQRCKPFFGGSCSGNILSPLNLVSFCGGAGQLRTNGCIEWESDQYSYRPKARCYPFDLPGHRWRGKTCQVSSDVISYVISYMTSRMISYYIVYDIIYDIMHVLIDLGSTMISYMISYIYYGITILLISYMISYIYFMT